ncbi:MAG: hypothetical protein R3C97_06045 [Geminicoccaceae bacterium]
MRKFAFIYRGGKPPANPEEGREHMRKWREWRDTLGDAMVEPGMPFSRCLTVAASGAAEGSGDVPLVGVSLVEADTIEAARDMAASCPHLGLGGDIVVAEGMVMEM